MNTRQQDPHRSEFSIVLPHMTKDSRPKAQAWWEALVVGSGAAVLMMIVLLAIIGGA